MKEQAARISPAAVPIGAGAGVLTIDLAALAANYRLLCEKAGPDCHVAGILKANAYGLGLTHVAGTLEKEDCPFYFAATPDEALALRGLTDKPVAALNGLPDGIAAEYIARGIRPVLNSLSDIEIWRAASRKAGQKLPAILHFDTGMNRLGIATRETARLLDDMALLDGIDVRLVMSHFACADQDSDTTSMQYGKFAIIAARFPHALKSLANSAGFFRGSKYCYDMVRPGMALYGLNPLGESPNPMRPVVTLEAPVLQVKTVPAGEAIGYGEAYRFEKEAVVATVGLGYADGFLRSLSNRGTLYYNGKACPIVGRVSMDVVTVAVEGEAPEPGALMEVIGPHQSADDLAKAAGTIGYEILTGLGPRYRRRYLSS